MSAIRGVRDDHASTTAGNRFAAAVPLVLFCAEASAQTRIEADAKALVEKIDAARRGSAESLAVEGTFAITFEGTPSDGAVLNGKFRELFSGASRAKHRGDLGDNGVMESGITEDLVWEVDPATGGLTILRWVVAHDCGRVLNPGLVDGQIHGGVVQGLADALNDQLVYDGGGQRLTATLMDYALATAADAPPTFEIRHLESPTPLNPLGAKGAGEGGIMPVHPVIAQAVEDALAPFGVRVTRVPVTRADIVAMIQPR